jgi:hypothetical protein
MELRTVSLQVVLLAVMGISMSGCATAPGARQEAPAIDKNMHLPVTFAGVWFRTDKVRLGLAYEETGSLTINGESMQFAYQNGSVRIPAESIQRVAAGKLTPDIVNQWLIVSYVDGATPMVAAFKFKEELFASAPSLQQMYAALRKLVLPGDTSADPLLELDTFNQLIALDRVSAKECNRRRIHSRQVISSDAKSATEHWVVNRCGSLVRYPITYSADPRGGTLIAWRPAEVLGPVR